MQTIQSIKNSQPEAITNLVERTPVQEGTKLSINQNQLVWEDLRGLTWILEKEDENC